MWEFLDGKWRKRGEFTKEDFNFIGLRLVGCEKNGNEQVGKLRHRNPVQEVSTVQYALL